MPWNLFTVANIWIFLHQDVIWCPSIKINHPHLVSQKTMKTSLHRSPNWPSSLSS
jgi:hypothetical protein